MKLRLHVLLYTNTLTPTSTRHNAARPQATCLAVAARFVTIGLPGEEAMWPGPSGDQGRISFGSSHTGGTIMPCSAWLIVTAALAAAPQQAPPLPPERGAEISADEETLRAAGLGVSDADLLAFFHTRARLETDWDKVRELVRQLGDARLDVRARAVADLVARGPLAVPLLRQAANDTTNPAAERARQCLRVVEGSTAAAIPAAAARVLAARKPAGTAQALLAYLPFADDEAV